MKTIRYTVFGKQTAYSVMLFVFLGIGLAGCGYIHFKKDTVPTEPYVARAYNKYLYLSDLQDKYQGGMSYEDSIYWTRNYINIWVQEQLLLHQAVSNLSEEEKDFSRQLEEYENSLLQYTYETRLIEQSLDTVITKDELRNYYNEHSDDFILNRNIVKVFYVVIRKDSVNLIKNMRRILVKNPLQLEEVERFCYNNDIPLFHADTSQWIYFDDLLDIIPIPNVNNSSSYLRYNKQATFSDDNYWYHIIFTEYRLNGGLSPFRLEKERITKIILSRRKESLIKKMRLDIFEDAQEKGAFEIL